MLTGAQPEQVAGKWVKGAKLRGSGGTLAQKMVGLGYQQVCGDAEVWGDGITPLPAAHLKGELLVRATVPISLPASPWK